MAGIRVTRGTRVTRTRRPLSINPVVVEGDDPDTFDTNDDGVVQTD
jgi:hypothetical protein